MCRGLGLPGNASLLVVDLSVRNLRIPVAPLYHSCHDLCSLYHAFSCDVGGKLFFPCTMLFYLYVGSEGDHRQCSLKSVEDDGDHWRCSLTLRLGPGSMTSAFRWSPLQIYMACVLYHALYLSQHVT